MLKISESLFDFEEVGNVSAEKVNKLADRILADYRKRKSEKPAEASAVMVRRTAVATEE